MTLEEAVDLAVELGKARGFIEGPRDIPDFVFDLRNELVVWPTLRPIVRVLQESAHEKMQQVAEVAADKLEVRRKGRKD